MAIPPLPASYSPPASTSKLTPFLTQPAGTLIAAGPAFLAHLQLTRHHDGDFSKHLAATAAARAAAQPANGNGEDDDLGVGEESEDEGLLSLDPKEWKKQDHYRVLGLSHLRFTANAAQIKVAHRKKVLRHHPDKKASDTTHTTTSALGINVNTNDDAFFKCIQKAHEVLTNPERRRQFDSVDPVFLDEIDDVPSAADFKTASDKDGEKKGKGKSDGKKPLPFLPTFAPIFAREARFSKTQPVPGLAVPTDGPPTKDPNDIEGHDFAVLKAHVESFYDFWYNFDSWRSFEWLDKEVNEGSDSRDDKRYTEKKNKSERARRKKEDIARVRGIVDLCLSVDPRIKHIKQHEKEAREAKKTAGAPGKKAPVSAAQAAKTKQQEEEEKKRKEEEEKTAKAEAKKAKAAAANAAKKARRAERAAEEGGA
ncbi:DnaJ-domain-containing protein [Mycena metata]|uniref:DnaJ-domain-containing protein n=1 Tax=Mycena metata TaxID=1033252 RepID=A0AAD7N4T4_9AGAR|nr:DnaJ-domain-containing protein [Mycena metata]